MDYPPETSKFTSTFGELGTDWDIDESTAIELEEFVCKLFERKKRLGKIQQRGQGQISITTFTMQKNFKFSTLEEETKFVGFVYKSLFECTTSCQAWLDKRTIH